MSIKRVLVAIIFWIIGILAIVVGERDDAPGAGLLGIVILIAGLYILLKKPKIKRK
jgi:uncharacterized membrane protein YfcA